MERERKNNEIGNRQIIRIHSQYCFRRIYSTKNPVDTVEPDEELVTKYEAKYQQFRKIYPALKDVFQKFD